ncbi:hypothetical protein RQP46_003346 [Phenoliferia psychrophenolica]
MEDAPIGSCTSFLHLPRVHLLPNTLGRRRRSASTPAPVARPSSVAFPTRITLDTLESPPPSTTTGQAQGLGGRTTRLSQRWANRMRDVGGRILSLPLPLLLSHDERQLGTATEASVCFDESRERPEARQRSFSFNLLHSPIPSPTSHYDPASCHSQAAFAPRLDDSPLQWHPWEADHWRGAPPPEPPLPPRARSLSPQNYRFPPSPDSSENGSFALSPPPPPGTRRNTSRNREQAQRRRRVRGGSLGEFDFELERDDDGDHMSRISVEMMSIIDDSFPVTTEEDLELADHERAPSRVGDETGSGESTDSSSMATSRSASVPA